MIAKGVITVENLTISFKDILWWLGFVVTLGSAIAVFNRFFSPFKELKARVDKLEAYQNKDHNTLKTLETGNEKICKCVLAITDHELTGNSVEKLRQAKDEMQDYLIEK
jgi:hypothetical protein